MQAIKTRYIGPTNTKGTRISAQCEAKRIVVSYDYALDGAGNHRQAALDLLTQLGWHRDGFTIQSGQLHTGDYVHVLILESRLKQ